MPNVICSLVLSLLALAPGGAQPKIYQASWQGDNVSGQLTINGFSISRLDGGPVSGTAPLNIWLVGKNEIRAELGKKDPKAPARFVVGVSELVLGDVASTGDRGTLINIELTNADLSGPAPKKIGRPFTSSLDFSAHLLASTPSRFDDKAVLDYAKTLHRQFQKKESKAILQAMSVKIEDYATAYHQPKTAVSDALASQLKDDIFKSTLAAIDGKKLRVERINNLWHIFDGNAELVRSKAADGSTSELPIFVGEVDGKLLVVR